MSGSAVRPATSQALRTSSRLRQVHQCLLYQRQLHIPSRPRLQQRNVLVGLRIARPASTGHELAGDTRSLVTRLKNVLYGTSLVLGVSFIYLYITDTRSSIHERVIVPIIRTAIPDAEDAHHVGNSLLKGLYAFGVHPRERGSVDDRGDLKVEVFGHVLDNPIGTSAGIDKNAEIPNPLLALGPGIVEVGGATPFPQEGNPKPRVWRVPSQNALINRYGLNSEGADGIAARLRYRVRAFAHAAGLGVDADAERKVLDGEAGVPPGSLTPGRLLAVQCAKMKTTPDDDIAAVAQDYVYCVNQLAKYADIIVVNVSSPNTPGLRSLQATAPLTAILTSVVGATKAVDRRSKPAVMVKVSPDEDSDEQVRGICDAVWASGVDGVIVGNTTKKRPDPLPLGYNLPKREEQIMLEQGGYSGPQLFERTVSLVKKYRKTLDLGPRRAPDSQKSKGPEAPKSPTPSESSETLDLTTERIEATKRRDEQRLKPLTPEAEADSKQPLLKLPERHEDVATQTHDLGELQSGFSASHHAEQGTLSTTANAEGDAKLQSRGSSGQSGPTSEKEKVIFATGGITNGKQALEVLNAGASVAMVYTALVYGGAGTITRIKSEMRDAIATAGPTKKLQ